MKAAEVTFQELLNGNIQYRVPLFQRTYSWTEENWKRLWDDLLDIYSLPVPRTHFLGAIVTLPMPGSPESAAKYMLVDGQQRLVTLLVLLSVIRDAAQAHGPGDLVTQIDEECLINKFAHEAAEHVKLRPTQKDEESFRAVVLGQGTVTDGPIGHAWKYFRKALADGDLANDRIELSKLKLCITAYFSLVSIRLDQNDSPHRIFESLNHTGMDLSAADLIRNHIFMGIPNEVEQTEAYEMLWAPMEKRLEANNKSEMTKFLWRYLMMSGDLVTQDEVYEKMRARVDEETQQKTMVQFLEELARFSRYYTRLWNPDDEQPSELHRCFERLNQWEVEVAYPFLMTLLDRLQRGAITQNDALCVVRGIESYVVRRYICGVPTNQLRNIFAQMAKTDPGQHFVKSCSALLQGYNWPNDADFRSAFQKATLYIRARLSRTRFILTALEKSYQHHETVDMTDNITIEHVMPQRLSDQWRKELGQSADQIHVDYLHTVGNLTYSGYNADMGNKSFADKRAILKKSKFELNRSIVRASKWGESEITRRGSELADRAVSIWKREM